MRKEEHRHGRSRGLAVLLLLAITISELFTNVVATKNYTPVVETTSGPVRGRFAITNTSKPYASFMGIRYGQAPIGNLRFKPPVPVERQNQTIMAIADGAACPQIDIFTRIFEGSEDCLFINVYTPVTDLKRKPKQLKTVMMWIYGGAFTSGSSAEHLYRPDYILEKDIVFVSMNYRGGAFGFLDLRHPNATGNMGLKDQVLAFKWVQANIENFGGNPNNVTIFGDSSGAACVGYHVLSDASKGLFHAAISMSGQPLDNWAFQAPEQVFSQAVKLGALLGIDSYDKTVLLDTFNRATAKEIVEATNQISIFIPPFAPTLEDESIATDVFLSECALAKYDSGNYSQVPQMFGFLADEGLFFFMDEQGLSTTVNFSIHYSKSIGMPVAPALIKVKKLIDSGTTIKQLSPSLINTVSNILSGILYTGMIDETQKRLAATSCAPIYYYYTTYYSNVNLYSFFFNVTLDGAAHGEDLMYIFYFPGYGTNPNSDLARTIDRYITMWTNFAKYGNPTPHWVKQPNINISWPDSRPSGARMRIGKELSIIPRPRNAEIKEMEHYTAPVLGILNGCPVKGNQRKF